MDQFIKFKHVNISNFTVLERVTNVPILFGDFKKHINVLLKRKWQSTTGYIKFILSWVCGLEVSEWLGGRKVF